MDIISSINAAFTQVQRFQNLSVSASGDNTRSQVGFRERESQSNVSGDMRGLQNLVSSDNSMPAQTGVASAVQNAVAYDRAEKGTLRLRTQEGDIVRLKFMNSESMNAQNQQFEEGGNVVSDFSLTGSNSSRFKVVVDGDLNGEELAAIREVLVQAREMANTFYDGEVKEAFAMAGRLDFNSEQLANVNMNFSLQENITYANASAVVNPAAVAPEEQTQPVAPPVDSVNPTGSDTAQEGVIAQVSQPDLAAVAPTSVESEPVAVSPEGSFVPETPIHTAPPGELEVASVLSTINNFLTQLTDSLNAFNSQFQNQASQTGFSFTGGFQLQMVSALVSQIEPASAERPFSGHMLAAATINEVAMKVDAKVDDVV